MGREGSERGERIRQVSRDAQGHKRERDTIERRRKYIKKLNHQDSVKHANNGIFIIVKTESVTIKENFNRSNTK